MQTREETRQYTVSDGKGGREKGIREDELAINFGHEECGAHVRPRYAFGGE